MEKEFWFVWQCGWGWTNADESKKRIKGKEITEFSFIWKESKYYSSRKTFFNQNKKCWCLQIKGVDGVHKGQKYADVINGWSLIYKYKLNQKIDWQLRNWLTGLNLVCHKNLPEWLHNKSDPIVNYPSSAAWFLTIVTVLITHLSARPARRHLHHNGYHDNFFATNSKTHAFLTT